MVTATSPQARVEISRAYAGITQKSAQGLAVATGRAKEDVAREFYHALAHFEEHMHLALLHFEELLKQDRDQSRVQNILQELSARMSAPYIAPLNENLTHFCQEIAQRKKSAFTHSQEQLQLQLALALLQPLAPRVWFDLGKAYELCSETISSLLSFAMAGYLTNGDLQLACETTQLFLDWEEKPAARALTLEVARDLISDPRYREEGFVLRERARALTS